MTTAKISQLEDHLGYWLRFVSNRVSEEFKAAVESCGVSVSDWVAMRILFERQDINHGELTEALGMTKGAVSKISARLENKGLVDRDGDKSDARLVVITLTEQGKALVPRLARLADENDRKFFGHFSTEQQVLLRELLEKTVRVHQLRTMPVA